MSGPARGARSQFSPDLQSAPEPRSASAPRHHTPLEQGRHGLVRVCFANKVKMSNQLDDSEESSQLLPFQVDLLEQLLPEPAPEPSASSAAQTPTTTPTETEVNALLILARGLGMRAIIANLVRSSPLVPLPNWC